MGRRLAGIAVLPLLIGAGCSVDLGEVPFYCCKDCTPECPAGYECKGNYCVKNGSCPDFVPNCCGNNKCEVGEDPATCPEDCSSTTCGNGTCDPGEDATSCPADCSGPEDCGDGTCASSESCTSCPADCGKCPTTCGNGTCDPGEDATSCPADCSDPADCGNGKCDPGEDATSCPEDCSSTGCTQDATKCDGTDKIQYCDGGVWKTETCEALCKAQYDYTTGCEFAPDKNKDVCLCGTFGQLGDMCDDKLQCSTTLFCGQFDQAKLGFCSKYCTSDYDCTGAPVGTKAACVLQVGTQTACGFLCSIYSCPPVITSNTQGTDMICQP